MEGRDEGFGVFGVELDDLGEGDGGAPADDGAGKFGIGEQVGDGFVELARVKVGNGGYDLCGFPPDARSGIGEGVGNELQTIESRELGLCADGKFDSLDTCAFGGTFRSFGGGDQFGES